MQRKNIPGWKLPFTFYSVLLNLGFVAISKTVYTLVVVSDHLGSNLSPASVNLGAAGGSFNFPKPRFLHL